jgi:hypothetical protein
MSSAWNDSDCNTDHMAAREEHYKKKAAWAAPTHREINSGELCEMGAQCSQPFRRESILRAEHIDIVPDEPVPRHSAAENMASVPSSTREARSLGYTSQGAVKTTSSYVVSSTYHHISKQDVAILIDHRDRARERETFVGVRNPLHHVLQRYSSFVHSSKQSSKYHRPQLNLCHEVSLDSTRSTREDSPSMTEDQDIGVIETSLCGAPTATRDSSPIRRRHLL